MNNWTVEACIKQFTALCFQAFTRRTGSNVPGVGWWIDNFNYSRYRTAPLVNALQTAFNKDEYLFGGRRTNDSPRSAARVAVTTASTTGTAVVLANYNRLQLDGSELLYITGNSPQG